MCKQLGWVLLTCALGASASPARAEAADAAARELPADLAALAAELQRGAATGGGAWDLVASLTTEVGPRLAGSEGDRRAVAWALAKLTALGFENVRAEPVTVPRWLRGEAAAEILEPWPQPLAVAALGGSVGTPAAGLTGEVIETANVASLEALPGEAVAGRIVFLSERMERGAGGRGYGEVVQNRGRGAVAAAKKGAIAVVIRSVGTDSHRFPHTGAMHYEAGVARIPAAALSNPDADLLAAQLASGRPVRLGLRLTCRDAGEAESANVVGELVGRELPQEIVLLGAHLDSWDLGTGALDDGAGVAVVTEAVRQIARLAERPRRTLRVVLYANEEFGLSGGKGYAAAHAGELDRHQAVLESDFGTGRVLHLRARLAAADAGWAPALHALVAPLGVGFEERPAWGGADVGPLVRAGVPAFDLAHDGTTYFDYHHTADDTLDKIDRAGLDQAVAAYATLALALADLPAPLGRAPIPEERGR